jgi:hypothetical protein
LLTQRLTRVVELARTANVELMTHPINPYEYDCLMSDLYRGRVAAVPMGSFARLPAACPRSCNRV